MIDHLALGVSDLAVSRAFYEAALAPLGFAVVMEWEGRVAFGPTARPIFFLGARPPVASGLHLAFQAADRDAVDAFHAAALAAGGHDNGKPGMRTQYHPHYYGAFVLDPDGNNAEAVCHTPA
jgi:catechol 2,3-dioxygenase-like lactoylglutathione lyase family enzyme